MKTIIRIMLKGFGTRLMLVFYVLLAVGAGFLLLYANDRLALALNDYLMVRHFDGFVLQLLLTVGLFALVFGLNTLGAYLHADFEYGTILRLACHYIARLLRARYAYFATRPAAELYAGLWTATQAVGRFFGNVLRIISGVVIFIFYGIVVFSFDVYAGIFTVLALPVYFLFTAGMGNRVSALQHAYVGLVGDVATVTQEAFDNVGNVKAKGAYAFFTERPAAVLRKLKRVCVKVLTVNGYINNITGLIRIVAPLLIIFAAMRISPDFEAGAGNIMVLYINIPLFLNGFADIHRGYIEYKMGKPFLSKLREFDDAPLEDEGGLDIEAFESLRTSGVKVAYDSGRVVTVPDFEVKKGEKVMLFGESGIGKSTLFNIIMGLYREYEGTVLINGINLREISLASLRRVFGITFQHTHALTLDLSGNILLGAEKTDADMQRLMQLTALENLHGETALTNAVLSGGEKSRVGLAQMLAANPQIMLIDEAFSNMDEALESKIIAALFREYPSRAVVCISHRHSSKPYFDRVVDFNTV